MGEIRVTIIGGDQRFPQMFRAIRQGVYSFNELHGTSHEVAEVVIQPGATGRMRVHPHILLSRIRIGGEDSRALAFTTIAEHMSGREGNQDHQVFIIEDLKKSSFEQRIEAYFSSIGLGGQVNLFWGFDSETIGAWMNAVFDHLFNVLERMDG